MADRPGDPRDARLGAWVAGVLAFVPAAVTLLVEVVAIRLLAPRIGSSLETYTAAIGVVLAGLALGAWLGGRAADAFGPRPLIAPILLVAAALVALVAPAVDVAAELLVPPPGPVGATILAVAGLLLPSIALAAATPVAARGTIVSREHSGSAVGRISAIATVGALLGTFATGFLLLPAFPVSVLLIGSALALVMTAVVLHVALRGPDGMLPTLALAITALATIFLGASAGPACDPPSAYYCIRIGRTEARPTVRDLVLDDLLHGSIDLAAPADLRFRYLRAMDAVVDAAFPPPAPLTALHVGGGAFALPRHFAAERPGTTACVLELDPAIVRLNREVLGLTLDEPELSIRLGDARSGLREEPAGRYALVIADVFAARAVPWHLVTREAMSEIRATMGPGAIYVANVIDGGELRLLGSYVRTLLEVFPQVEVVFLEIPGGVSGNVIVLAGDSLPLDAITASIARDAAEPARLATEAELAAMAGGAVLLTDDYAPTDALISR
jgi:spermidine synthase